MAEGNPFKSKRVFIGRKDLISELEEYLSSATYYEPQIVLLKGIRGVGKTYIIEKIEELAERYKFLLISISLSKKEKFNEKVVNEIANTAIYNIVEIPSKNDKTFFEKIKKEKKEAHVKIEEIYEKIKRTIHGMFVSVENAEKIDDINAVNRLLEKILKTKLPIMIAFSTSCILPIKAKKSLELESFSEKETRNFIDEHLKETKVSMGEECIKNIYRDSQGHPFILWIICSTLFSKLKETEKIITQGHYLLHFPSIMSKLAKELFDELYNKLSDGEKEILKLFEDKQKSIKEITEISGKPMNTVTTIVLRLERKGSVVRVKRGFYRVINKLYSEYVKERD